MSKKKRYAGMRSQKTLIYSGRVLEFQGYSTYYLTICLLKTLCCTKSWRHRRNTVVSYGSSAERLLVGLCKSLKTTKTHFLIIDTVQTADSLSVTLPEPRLSAVWHQWLRGSDEWENVSEKAEAWRDLNESRPHKEVGWCFVAKGRNTHHNSHLTLSYSEGSPQEERQFCLLVETWMLINVTGMRGPLQAVQYNALFISVYKITIVFMDAQWHWHYLGIGQ